MNNLQKLKEKWNFENISCFKPTDLYFIEKFQLNNNVILPNDIIEYFKTLNGTGEEYTDELYEFYSLERIKQVSKEFQDWKGAPDYQNLLTLNEAKDLFVFANFSFNLFAYAIRLSNKETDVNEIFVLCGGDYKKIANSFSEFLELYLNDSIGW